MWLALVWAVVALLSGLGLAALRDEWMRPTLIPAVRTTAILLVASTYVAALFTL